MNTALEVRDLSVRFPGEPAVAAVDGVSLAIEPGEVVGLVGESGCGKSATANAIMGLLPRSAVSARSIRLGQRELTRLDEPTMRRLRGREISMVFQEPQTALDPVLTIGSQVKAVLRRHGVARRATAADAAADALRRMGLADAGELMRRYPHQLSGGMRQRVLIAMAMAARPAVLLADEPTTALDVTTQAQVLDELLRLGSENRTAILLITHDLSVAARICGRIIVMRRGKLVETAAADTIFSSPTHPWTAELVRAIPRIDTSPPQPPSPATDYIIELERHRVSHPVRVSGRRRQLVAVRDVSLQVRRGEILGLVGESGCGKSTLAQSLLGLKPAESGQLRFAGAPVTGRHRSDWARVRRHAQLVFQDPRASLSPRRTVAQSLLEPLEHFGIDTPAGRRARVTRVLEHVGLDSATGSNYPHELSGGQRQRVALARALISKPDLVVADEPLSSLDVSIQARIIRLLRSLRQEMGFAILLVSHDLAVIRQLADRIAVMYLGRIVETGPTDALFRSPAHPYTQALLRAVTDAAHAPRERPKPAFPGLSEPPSLLTPPPGCVFHTRCPEVMARCTRVDPPEIRVDDELDADTAHKVRCLLYEDLS